MTAMGAPVVVDAGRPTLRIRGTAYDVAADRIVTIGRREAESSG